MIWQFFQRLCLSANNLYPNKSYYILKSASNLIKKPFNFCQDNGKATVSINVNRSDYLSVVFMFSLRSVHTIYCIRYVQTLEIRFVYFS